MDRDSLHLLTIFFVVFILAITEHPGNADESSLQEDEIVWVAEPVTAELAQK